MSNEPLLSQALELHRWLEDDRDTADQERLKRDRRIGQRQTRQAPLQQVLSWWAEMSPHAESNLGTTLVQVRRTLTFVLLGVGLLVGVGVCSVALTYTGDYPINLLALLGVLLLLPLSLLVLTLVFCLLQGLGVGAAGILPHWMSPGRWSLDVFERFTGLEISGSYGQTGARGRLGFWQVVVFSQWFGISFYLGAILALAVLVSISDLAFGWSTTLTVEPSSVLRLLQAVALPWASLWPAAYPDVDLVAASRIFRLAGEAGVADAALLGGWWKFVFMALLCWGLLPRLLLLILGSWRLYRATQAYVLEHSEITALLDRLSTPLLDLGHQHEAETARPVITDAPQTEAQPWQIAQSFDDSYLLIWNDALAGDKLRPQNVQFLSSLSSSTEIADQISMIPDHYNKVVVLTKSWEPPLLEFLDVLELVRAHVGKKASIAVIPLGLQSELASADDVAIWSGTVAKLADAGTYVTSYGGQLGG